MPDVTGGLVSVIGDLASPEVNVSEDKTLLDRRKQAKVAQRASGGVRRAAISPTAPTAQDTLNLDKQFFADALNSLSSFDSAINRDRKVLGNVNKEITEEYEKLQKYRWIDDIFGPETRQLLGIFEPDLNDARIARKLTTLGTKQKNLQAQIKFEQEARKSSFDNAKKLLDTRHAINEEERKQIKFGAEQAKFLIENADLETLRGLKANPMFAGFGGLINKQMVDRVESQVKGMTVEELRELAAQPGRSPMKALAREKLREIDADRIALAIDEAKLGQENLELEKSKRNFKLTNASLESLRAAMTTVTPEGYVNLKGTTYPAAAVQQRIKEKLEVYEDFRKGEFEKYEMAFNINNNLGEMDSMIRGLNQAEIQIASGLTNRVAALKQLQEEGVSDLFPAQMLDRSNRLKTAVAEAADKLVKENYNKEVQPAMREFLTQRRFNNAENASKVLVSNFSPNMGTREGSVFASAGRLLSQAVSENLDASFISASGQIDLAKVASNQKSEFYQQLANIVVNPETGVQQQLMIDVALNYFNFAMKQFEAENPDAVGADGFKMADGKPVFDSSTYLYQLYQTGKGPELMQKFLDQYNDGETQEMFVRGVRGNANPQEAALLKLALDNSIKNILIRKGVEISSVEKLQTVQNRYEQIHRRDMEQQTAQAGFLRTAREVVDNAIDNGDDFKTIMRKVEHYMGTKRLQPDTLELLKQYVNQKTQENKPMTERQSITNPMFENVLQSLDIGAP